MIMPLGATVHTANERTTGILEAACRVIVREGAHGLRMASVAENFRASAKRSSTTTSRRDDELLRSAFAFSVERRHAAVNAELVGVTTGRRKVDRMLLVRGHGA